MTVNTNASGVAVCRCGAELEIRCTAGCAEPDFVFRSDLVQTCNWPGCDEPVPPRQPGQLGRERKRCQKHTDLQDAYRAKSLAKRSA